MNDAFVEWYRKRYDEEPHPINALCMEESYTAGAKAERERIVKILEENKCKNHTIRCHEVTCKTDVIENFIDEISQIKER